jgi:hypothetical protein
MVRAAQVRLVPPAVTALSTRWGHRLAGPTPGRSEPHSVGCNPAARGSWWERQEGSERVPKAASAHSAQRSPRESGARRGRTERSDWPVQADRLAEPGPRALTVLRGQSTRAAGQQAPGPAGLLRLARLPVLAGQPVPAGPAVPPQLVPAVRPAVLPQLVPAVRPAVLLRLVPAVRQRPEPVLPPVLLPPARPRPRHPAANWRSNFHPPQRRAVRVEREGVRGGLLCLHLRHRKHRRPKRQHPVHQRSERPAGALQPGVLQPGPLQPGVLQPGVLHRPRRARSSLHRSTSEAGADHSDPYTSPALLRHRPLWFQTREGPPSGFLRKLLVSGHQ